MHPTYSIIAFTTLSGAGFGLGALLCLGGLPVEREIGFAAWGLVFFLTVSGLAASLLHLGHPERFILALSQWRSSWLSREGVLALLCLGVFAIIAAGWVFLLRFWWPVALAGAVLAIATVFSTAMIYASLKTIRHWSNPFTVPVYLLFALSNGACLYLMLAAMAMHVPRAWIVFCGLLVIVAMLVQIFSWRFNDAARSQANIGTATGLGRLGRVRELERPHLTENYLQSEMGYRVGRKHAATLRLIAIVTGLGVPLALLAVAFYRMDTLALWFGLGALAHFIATLITRWLFFAQARHTVMLYYGDETA